MSRAVRVWMAMVFAGALAIQGVGQSLHLAGGAESLEAKAEAIGGNWTHVWGTTSSSRVVSQTGTAPGQKVVRTNGPVAPFSRIAVGTRSGTLGLGVQVATPIARWLNLRGGMDLLNFGLGAKIDGASYEGEAHLRSGQVSLDYFPFHWGFHISPGVLIYKSGFSASVDVPAGNSFDLGELTFVSGVTDPIHGSAALVFANTMMPALTIGFGNMVAREGRHWSVPVEFGVAYSGHYTAQLNLKGTACINLICQSTTTPDIQQNVQDEENILNEATKRYQIYPIVTGGISYRF